MDLNIAVRNALGDYALEIVKLRAHAAALEQANAELQKQIAELGRAEQRPSNVTELKVG